MYSPELQQECSMPICKGLPVDVLTFKPNDLAQVSHQGLCEGTQRSECQM